MSGKKKKVIKINDRQYSEYIAALRAQDEENEESLPDDGE